jgi:hypothetical protein
MSIHNPILAMLLLGLLSLYLGCHKGGAARTHPQDAGQSPTSTVNARPLFALSQGAIDHVITDSLVRAGKSYLKAHPELSAEVRQGIITHALYRGMTVQEASLAIGQLERRTPNAYRFRFEGLLLRFDQGGRLESVVEQ